MTLGSMMMQLTQSETLANTNEDTTSDEDADVSTRRKCLHKRGHDDESSANSHSHTTSSPISKGTTHEETCHYSTDCV